MFFQGAYTSLFSSYDNHVKKYIYLRNHQTYITRNIKKGREMIDISSETSCSEE
jgi:hypothetical protein